VVRGIKSIWPWANQSIKQDIPIKNVPTINVDGPSSQSSDSTVDESDQIIRLRKSRMTAEVNEKNISSSSIQRINPSTPPNGEAIKHIARLQYPMLPET
ncbi:2301_t:CDS:2, partial [Racocetra fulgida]